MRGSILEIACSGDVKINGCSLSEICVKVVILLWSSAASVAMESVTLFQRKSQQLNNTSFSCHNPERDKNCKQRCGTVGAMSGCTNCGPHPGRGVSDHQILRFRYSARLFRPCSIRPDHPRVVLHQTSAVFRVHDSRTHPTSAKAFLRKVKRSSCSHFA